jgi:hypothetical protein
MGEATAVSKTGADLFGNRRFESISLQQSAANLTSSIGRSLRGRRLDTICDALGATSCSARLPPFSFGIAIWRE